MVNIKEWVSVSLRQTKILLRKNWILQKRNLTTTLLQICVPFIFVLFLWVLQFGLRANARLNELNQNVPAYDREAIGSMIPRCIAGPDRDDCITIAYTTNDDIADGWIEEIRANNGIPVDEIRKFASLEEMNTFNDDNVNTTQAAYIFEVMYNETTGIRSFHYTLQYNQTPSFDQFLIPVEPIYRFVVPMQYQLQKAIVNTVDPSLEYSVDLLPFPHPEIITVDIVADNGPPFFFGALMFNFVIQMGQIVSEKELKLRDYMSLMGLRNSVFWFTWWVTNTILNVISVMVLIISGYIFQFDFFLKNDFRTFFVLFFLFGLAMVPLCFALSTLVKQSRTATSLGFVIFLIGVIIQGFAALAFSESFSAFWRGVFSLLPFALLGKGIADISAKSAAENDDGFKWSERSTNDFYPLSRVYEWLIIDFFVFLFLTWYLDNVMPNSHGVRRPPWFFLLPSYWIGPTKSSVKKKKSSIVNVVSSDLDEDVEAERTLVASGTLPNDTPVIVNNLQKTYVPKTLMCIPRYKRAFTAVDKVTYHIRPNSLFCLLGHNGAGKTTTINMLTGMFAPSSGDATIFGYSILDQMDEIRKLMGVCPQHDILWDQMTGKEHLEMFAAFKGMSGDALKEEVNARLQDVELVEAANLNTAAYSGGMKRRLSTAIALTADPQVVFLDEPTTGMDPVSRRQVWNLIERVKRGRVIVLTTHSMEEADVLGDHIAIMKKGQLECFGSSIRLKNKFGAGYRVSILANKNDFPAIEKFFEKNLDQKVSATTDTFMEFNIPREVIPKLPAFFKKLEKKQDALHIEDVQLSMTTLEENLTIESIAVLLLLLINT